MAKVQDALSHPQAKQKTKKNRLTWEMFNDIMWWDVTYVGLLESVKAADKYSIERPSVYNTYIPGCLFCLFLLILNLQRLNISKRLCHQSYIWSCWIINQTKCSFWTMLSDLKYSLLLNLLKKKSFCGSHRLSETCDSGHHIKYT